MKHPFYLTPAILRDAGACLVEEYTETFGSEPVFLTPTNLLRASLAGFSCRFTWLAARVWMVMPHDFEDGGDAAYAATCAAIDKHADFETLCAAFEAQCAQLWRARDPNKRRGVRLPRHQHAPQARRPARRVRSPARRRQN